METSREALDRHINQLFPQRLDAFYSPTSGTAVVMDRKGDLWRVLPSGIFEKM